MKENILDSKVVKVQNGRSTHYERLTWLRGHYEGLGEHIQGWSGNETLVREHVVKPVVIFEVHIPDDEFEFQYNPARKLP